MGGVSVVVPWRAGCPHREAAWRWVRTRYDQHPTWDLQTGGCDDGPWVKARAVRDGLNKALGDILVLADADVWTDGLAEAVELVRGGAAWAVPHLMVNRLSHEATEAVLDGGPVEGKLEERAYRGHIGGGVVVLRRDLYEECPLDPRFAGWGAEDDSFGHALSVLAGRPERLRHDLWHLWHPPQVRPSRTRGSDESWALLRRYRRTRNPARIRALIAEHREVATV